MVPELITQSALRTANSLISLPVASAEESVLGFFGELREVLSQGVVDDKAPLAALAVVALLQTRQVDADEPTEEGASLASKGENKEHEGENNENSAAVGGHLV